MWPLLYKVRQYLFSMLSCNPCESPYFVLCSGKPALILCFVSSDASYNYFFYNHENAFYLFWFPRPYSFTCLFFLAVVGGGMRKLPSFVHYPHSKFKFVPLVQIWLLVTVTCSFLGSRFKNWLVIAFLGLRKMTGTWSPSWLVTKVGLEFIVSGG